VSPLQRGVETYPNESSRILTAGTHPLSFPVLWAHQISDFDLGLAVPRTRILDNHFQIQVQNPKRLYPYPPASSPQYRYAIHYRKDRHLLVGRDLLIHHPRHHHSHQLLLPICISAPRHTPSTTPIARELARLATHTSSHPQKRVRRSVR